MISAAASLRASLPLAPAVPTPVERLRALYAYNRWARALLDAAAERTQRAWRETALATARTELHDKLGERPPKRAVIEVFKELHTLGVVRHVVGRSGHQTRIEWVYRSPSVAAVAAGRAADFEKWGQSERARRRRKERLAKRSKSQPNDDAAAITPVADAKPTKKAASQCGSRRKAKEPQVVLDLGCGVAVTWNRPRHPTPAEAEQFAKAVAATVQSLAGVGA
jgi:hypothetical protein